MSTIKGNFPVLLNFLLHTTDSNVSFPSQLFLDSPHPLRHTPFLSFSLENQQANKQKIRIKNEIEKNYKVTTHTQTPKHKTHKNANPLYTWKSNPTFLHCKVSKMCTKPDQCSLVQHAWGNDILKGIWMRVNWRLTDEGTFPHLMPRSLHTSL